MLRGPDPVNDQFIDMPEKMPEVKYDTALRRKICHYFILTGLRKPVNDHCVSHGYNVFTHRILNSDS